MKILWIIGNGFDLNLNLKTSYHDFYQYYKTVESKNATVQKLKENISASYESWADLELQLGDYTQHLKTEKELDDIMLDIGNELSKYLTLEEQKIEKYEIDQQKFFAYLQFPEKLFLPADKEKLSNHKKKWLRSNWEISIYTFNYTSIIEKIIGENQNNVLIGKRGNNLTDNLREFQHIHGSLKKNMVMGVNDVSQLANENFHKNPNILEQIVKSECINANKELIDRKFTAKISEANLICIFGSSIGDTDTRWWELIGQRLKQDCNLIIFSIGEEIPERIRFMQTRAERTLRDLFLSKTKLSEKEMASVETKIFIGLNTGMFNDILKHPRNPLDDI